MWYYLYLFDSIWWKYMFEYVISSVRTGDTIYLNIIQVSSLESWSSSDYQYVYMHFIPRHSFHESCEQFSSTVMYWYIVYLVTLFWTALSGLLKVWKWTPSHEDIFLNFDTRLTHPYQKILRFTDKKRQSLNIVLFPLFCANWNRPHFKGRGGGYIRPIGAQYLLLLLYYRRYMVKTADTA